ASQSTTLPVRRSARDWRQKFFQGDGSFISFCHYAPYLMTVSARIITTGGIVRPRDFAVLRLITSSNFVGCSTGMSAGFVPFRILSILDTTRLGISEGSAP